MKKFTIVTDPGIDDIVALVLLHNLIPGVKNTLVSTFGNAPQAITSLNAKQFISFVANSWQFKDGSKLPMNGIIERPWPDYFHGPDGVWGIHPNADISKINSIKDYPNTQDGISLSPLTDTYKLYKKGRFSNLTIMGGAFNIQGNETKYAETNIAFDPDSAHHLFEELSNIKLKVVPLDVTRQVFWTIEQVIGIPETNQANMWLKKLLLAWFDKYNHDKEKDFNLHDPLAVYLTLFPDEAIWKTSGVEVVVSGEKRGQTVFKSANPNCEVAVGLVNPKATAISIFERAFKY